MSPNFQLGLASCIPAPPDLLRDFLGPLEDLGVRVHVEARREAVFAGAEWLLPTAVILLVSRKYFETLLEEAAKDHYPVLKSGVNRLLHRLVGPHRDIRLTRIPSVQNPEKLSGSHPGGLSIYVELAPGLVARFIYEEDLDEMQYGPSVDALVRCVRDNRDVILKLASVTPRGPSSAVIFRFDSEEGAWYHWNPRLGPCA